MVKGNGEILCLLIGAEHVARMAEEALNAKRFIGNFVLHFVLHSCQKCRILSEFPYNLQKSENEETA